MSSTSAATDLALPKGSLILVTGASGFIGSHVVKEALDFGYRVRGTVRSEKKAELVSQTFHSKDFSTCMVQEYTNSAALDAAVKDCDGIIHTAADVSLSPNASEVIPSSIAIALSVLEAANRSGTCKRFVFTSSSSAATFPRPNTKFRVEKSMWNQDAVDKAWEAKPPYPPLAFYHVYAASKTEAERAVWKFVEEKEPCFAVNTILPSTNMGRVLLRPATSSANFAIACLNGRLIAGAPAHWMINVDDDARIHLGALLDSSVANERILAYGQRFEWNDVLEAVRKARPDAKSLPEPLKSNERDLSEVDNVLGAVLLRKWFGQSVFKSLDDSVCENLEGYGQATEKIP